MVLQESLEAGYKADYLTDDGGIHPDFFKPCITCCRRTTRTCWTSREQVESRCQDPSNFVAESAPRPLKLRRSDPPLTHCTGGSCTGGRRWPPRRRPRHRPLAKEPGQQMKISLVDATLVWLGAEQRPRRRVLKLPAAACAGHGAPAGRDRN